MTRYSFVLPLLLSLTACGGGSVSLELPTVTVFPVSSVLTRLATVGEQFKANSTDSDGVQYAMTLHYAPAGTGGFTVQEVIAQNGVAGQSLTTNITYSSPIHHGRLDR